ncbi:MAG: alpha/beta hydrolase [Telluria sp.]
MTSTLSTYHLGKTVSFACRVDPRFSFCLYVPPGYRQGPAARILVAVHGTDRHSQSLRDLFCDFAQASNTIVLAPLFPVGIEDDDLDNYKYLGNAGIRYDEIVLAMVAQVAEGYGVDAARFSLFGFSGGAHLAHRLFYVHPERLHTVVVGAPGSVSLPDERHAWWAGVKDYDAVFGRPVPWAHMRQVRLHLVVGGNDINPKGIIQGRADPRWVEGADSAGANRLERVRSLYVQLREHGMQVSLAQLDGVGHQVGPIAGAAIEFLSRAERAAP